MSTALHELGDEAVAAADRRVRLDEQAHDVDLGERRAEPARCVRSPSSVRGLWMPGRVEQHDLACRASCARRGSGVRVVCGRSETIETFVPTSWLTSVDFPTFGPADERDEPGAERHAVDRDAASRRSRRVDVGRAVGVGVVGTRVITHRHDAAALDALGAELEALEAHGLARPRARGRAG